MALIRVTAQFGHVPGNGIALPARVAGGKAPMTIAAIGCHMFGLRLSDMATASCEIGRPKI